MFFDIEKSFIHKYFVLLKNRHIALSALLFSFISYGISSLSLYFALFIEAVFAGDISKPASDIIFTPFNESNVDKVFADFYTTVLIAPLIETLLFHVVIIWITVKVVKNIAISVVLNALLFSCMHFANDIFASFHTALSGLFYAYGFLFWKEQKGSVNAGIQFTFSAHSLHNLWSLLTGYIAMPWIH